MEQTQKARVACEEILCACEHVRAARNQLQPGGGIVEPMSIKEMADSGHAMHDIGHALMAMHAALHLLGNPDHQR